MNFVILCGGTGSRLWPKSKEKMPKQFLRLTNEYTMFQNTILRINKIINTMNLVEHVCLDKKLNKIYVICNKDHNFIVNEQYLELKLNINICVVSEPKGRDSGPAICISSLLSDPQENTFIMPCDHIFDDNEFINCTIKSLDYIDESIITFGIKPMKPEIGYGYIKVDENNKTKKFIEKPNITLAEEYFKNGNYLWNAGIFIFKNKNMINCFKKYANDILENCIETIANTYMNNKNDMNNIYLSAEPFIHCKAISIDYCIMENIVNNSDNKCCSAITITYNSYWNDIGSYAALYNEVTKNNDNNFIKGHVLTINTKNSYIETDSKFTSVIGIDNLIIVNSDDSLLICNKDDSQNVKQVVDYLKKNNYEEAYFHKKVFRPWGYYVNIEGSDYNGFRVKKIAVYQGKRLSLQSHDKRSEHWVIVKGNAKVQIGTNIIIMKKDDYVYIPIKTLHRIENIGDDLLEFTETQIGDYLGEDDIIRYEDDFGRI